MTLQEARQTLIAAQHGDEEAKNKVVKAMMESGCMHRLRRYMYLNRLMDKDEVNSEFWLGVAKALPHAKPEVGNPLAYLTQRGIWHVGATLRKRIIKQVIWACPKCGLGGSLRQRRGGPCPRCGSWDVETHERTLSIEVTPEIAAKEQPTGVDLEAFERGLTPRHRQILSLMRQGMNRQCCKNYLKDISEELGVSTACVAIHLRKIRERLDRYIKQEAGTQ